MQQILNVWSALNMRRRVIVLAATIAVFVAVLSLTRMATTPGMALLYSGLESGPAGEVVRALEQRGVSFQIRGGAIYVDSSQRDALRMTLASEGLPANTNSGYELLDTLSGFGTTSQMFDAAYWRAKEGELARTITGSPRITGARVHIANTNSNPFRRDVTPTASVSVTTAGGPLSAEQARAFRYLVASAVAGLAPEDVVIIDGINGLIGKGDETPSAAAGLDDRATRMRDRVQNLLEARVGPGNAVVELSVESVTETESIRERTFDPASRVAISTDTEERSTSSRNSGDNGVTVASNLPDGDAAKGESSTKQDSETRERVNYEVSETEREITRVPGAVKRLTVAVLVNATQEVNADGETVFIPRPEEELAALRELVASAVGLNEARGDVITLKSMAFEPVLQEGTAATTSLLDRVSLDLMSVIQTAVLALVALLLGLFVVRPLLTRSAADALPATADPARLGSWAASEQDGAEGSDALTGEVDDGAFDFSTAGDLPELNFNTNSDFDALGASDDSRDPVDRLRALIGERQEETVEILRNWLEDREENA
ncbi:flagellar M-ring protein FliF [Salinihabitans flavidus]|uniref:Flagellar M-ring protein n=1 Tax=Salinihabitans flavidus TaxID=569882 RepID=A0A1H8LRJ5_9RHOB|nr:flagellar basal-body MS-ring/collar protein FliF [Salinihabitans flavidus]SEO07725.1 flagellar M-ring protein FliF [Salinihabitans flavidus]